MPSLSSAWSHVSHNYRQGGLRQIAHKLILRAFRPLWSQTTWLVYHIDLGPDDRQPAMPLVERELTMEDLRRFRHYKTVAFPDLVRARFARGARCHGFFIGDELVNTSWTTVGYLSLEDGFDISEPRCAGIFDCYTEPGHRSKGIYKETLARLLLDLREEGADLALIAVDPGNYPSIRGIERAGFTPFCRVIRQRRFGFSVVTRSEFLPRLTT